MLDEHKDDQMGYDIAEPIEQNKIVYHAHYYGKIVRAIFIVGALTMLVSFPFFSHLINLPLPIHIFFIVLFVVIGGLISPLSKSIFILGSIVPVFALAMFEYYALYTYKNLSGLDGINVAFFWVNQILALMFIFAMYLSIKTLRAMVQGKMISEEVEQ